MAIDLGGVSSIATTSPVLPATGDFTVAVWVYPNTTAGRQRLVTQATTSSSVAGRFYLSTSISGTGKARLFISGTQSVLVDTVTSVPINTWSLVTVVREASTFRLYLGGSLEASQTMTGVLIDQTSLQIGEDGLGDFFDGKIAELGVWHVALNDQAIAHLALGHSPLTLTSWLSSLALYQDLIRTLNHPAIGPSMAASGATLPAEHPPIRYQSTFRFNSALLAINPGVALRTAKAQLALTGAAAGSHFLAGAEQSEIFPFAEAMN